MRASLTLAVGAVFTCLLLVLPASHGVRWLGLPMDGADWALVALPFLALIGAAARPRPWVTLWGFPASHLPALVAEPRLASGAVFGEGGAVWAAVALGVVGTGWYLVHLWPARRVPRPRAAPGRPSAGAIGHPLSLTALALTLAIFGAFARAALSASEVDAVAAGVTVMVGAVAVWLVVAQGIAGALGDVVLSPSSRRRARARLLRTARPAPRTTWTTLGAAAVAGGAAATWYLWAR